MIPSINHRRLLLLLLLFAAGSHPLVAQSLSLFEIDPSDFPRIRGKFIAVDADGHSYRPDPTDLHLFEGETARNITLLDCPPPTPLEPISAVLVLDVSSSMLVSDGRNLEIARSAARAWIDGMALGLSECAVTSFEERSFLVQDFTIDSRRLHDAVDQLVPFGGTGYNAAFLSPVTGAIPVATRGKHRRIIIFLTDGRGSGNEEEIVRQATAANATIHCVTVGLPAPDILKNVATRTGGRWFENVETPEEAAAIYRTLLLQAQGGEPCRIEWTSAPSCDPVRDVRLEERRLGTEALARYIVPAAGITNLTIADDELRFGVVAAGNAATMATAITASGGPVRILSVTSSHPRFTITSGQAPPDYTVASGNSQQIAIRYDAENTDYTVAKITIETEGCDRVIYAAAGRWGGADDPQGGEPPPIRLVFPNGGERFAVGSTTAMTWTGVLPTDTVRLDYSTDAGQTWLPVAEKATGLRQPWLVPNTPSFTCLARVSIDGVGGNSDTGAPFARVLHTYRGHDDRVFGGPLARARFSPDGSHVASASTKLTDQLRVWKSLDGAFFDDRTPAARIRDIDWSADGTKVAMATDEGGGQVTVGSFTTTDRVSFPARDVTTVALRQDIPGMIATGHRNGEVRLWNDDGSLDRTIGAGELGLGEISALAYRPNNAELLIAGRGTNGDADTMKIYTTDGRFQALFPRNAGVTTHTAGISSARFSPDGSQIISVGFDGIAYLWDRLGGRPQRELRGHNDGAISPDGRLVVIGNGDTIWTSGNRPSTPLIYDAQTGVELDRLDGEHTGAVTSVDITQIGEVYYVVTASLDSTVVVWEIAPRGSGGGTGPGVDESDDLWAIVAAGITTNEVDFGRRNVGSTTDSVVTALIRNVGDIAVDVDSLAIIGPDATSFSVVSGDAPFTIPARSNAAVELRFAPDRIGPFTGSLDIFSSIDTLRAPLRGEGVAALLAIETEIVDFGAVEIGDARDSLVTVVLRNIGSIPLTITGIDKGGPDLTSFSILAGDAPFTIAPGGTHGMRLQFRPSETGGTTGSLRFHYGEPGSPGIVLLFGSGFCPSSITRVATSLAPMQAPPGDTLLLPFAIAEIPVTGPAPPPDPATIIPLDFELDIRYNRTLLAPLDSDVPITLGEVETVARFFGTWDPVDGEILWKDGVAPRFIVGLGNVEQATIAVDGMRWLTGCPPDVALASAPFTLDHLCREGTEVRLFEESGQTLRLALASANPVRDRLDLLVGLIEEGGTTISLTDMQGRTLRSLLDVTATPGSYAVSADIAGIAAGGYFVLLETPTLRRTLPIIIGR